MSKIPLSYYREEDVVILARDLLGKVLCTNVDGAITKGIITETEAYNGAIDKACHAYGNRRTNRTEIMFQEGGKAYVYLCYGIHHLFNIVNGKEGTPTAVLIRGVFPLEGVGEMMQRRDKSTLNKLSAGPGTLSKALGIHTKLTGTNLDGDIIWLEDHQILVPKNEVQITPRIGVDYAEEDALLPYRFVWGKKK